MNAEPDQLPAWLREIDVALAANPQLLITGNLHDIVLVAIPPAPMPRMLSVVDALLHVLGLAGHTRVVVADPVDGARAALDADGVAAQLVRTARAKTDADANLLDYLPALLQGVVHAPQPCCLVIDGASRLSPTVDFTDEALHRALITAHKLMLTAKRVEVPGPHRTALYNTVFWLLDREGDLPHWLIGGELARVVSIPAPGLRQRLTLAGMLAGSLPEIPDRATRATEFDAIVARYAARTSGLTLHSIREINRLAIDRRIPAVDIDDAIRTFRVGIPDNPWQDPALRERIRLGPTVLAEKVKGQPAAVRKSVDILIRSALGLSGAQTTSSSARPQGVLFFAGPTGVGKTELAKSIAELVFGRDDAFIRFDMSEFSAEHAEARLIGAPPGYSGHNAGGELTNAIRQQPFQLALFDEIEKAHPRILDKFLQILEDGRLTDGTGATVFFSETLLVFTSNLGVYRTDDQGIRVPVVTRGTAYREVERTIRAAVGEHFTKEIGRPELLNRIGDNIVVFDFIDETTARELVGIFVENVCARVLAVTGVTVAVDKLVLDQLHRAAVDKLDFGGRGVGSTVESMLVNPLARALFEVAPRSDAVTITGIVETEESWAVALA
ncbi:AAA family ATPase [Nocardia caishijiensis]|uniref:Cdc48 subfamily AAA family protein n=1 Tax=Nocardia caishijiensis TaxID=184756 RepID=A0ABQ6YHN4_9NOCA|nr:AAA family ATPase [Nocardia caishijiensis]KAF0845280.1 Cdc48 subfamily AAA family protein [Nocardia caishijiensis]